MSLGGGQTIIPFAGDMSGGSSYQGALPQLVGNDKYSQIMELMRRRNAMSNSTNTGGFNAYPVAAPPRPYSDLIAQQASANREFGPGGDSDLGRGGFDGYGPNVSPLSNPMTGSGLYGFLDAYGNALGGMLPFGLVAQTIAQSMNPGQIEQAGKLSSQALSDAIAGYTSGTMFGAPPSDPSTFGGAGYGTAVADGGFGVTGMTGAGVAAKGGMGVDPAQAAQGIAAANAAAAAQAASDAAIADAAEAEGFGLGPAATGDVGGNDSVGGGFGGNDGSGEGFGGIYSRGGYVNKKHLKGPNPMGPDDGYGGLDDGEYVINAKSVGKYGIELMNAINAGKISKGKLRGLLEA